MMETDAAAMAKIAGGRARFYDLLVGVFSHLPDERFLRGIKGNGLKSFLEGCCDMKSSGFRSGVDYINAYQSRMNDRPAGEIQEELSIDRTGILRGTGDRNLKPPYEGLYKGKKNYGDGDSLLGLKSFYREAGLMPDDSVREAPDYLCVELDFMKHLCLREQNQWSSGGDTTQTLAHEEAFLRDHLGGWIGDFCEKVREHALTDFFRGFALIMGAFISMDMAFLDDMDLEKK